VVLQYLQVVLQYLLQVVLLWVVLKLVLCQHLLKLLWLDLQVVLQHLQYL
jgi:hypothetical protein